MSHRASPLDRAVLACFRGVTRALLVGLAAALPWLAQAQSPSIPAPSAYDEVSRLMRAQQLDQALSRAQDYLRGNPRDPQMRFLLGVAQNQKGDSAAALETFTNLTQDNPELPEPHNNLAVLHAAAGRYDEARVALEAAIRANPRYAVALENLGDVYARLAERAWQRARDVDAQNPRLAPKLKAVQSLLATTPR
ncbi:tetratricopeptide repeat protein [Hydrogenophaga sp. YM1]|jgi:tetratricopeptide (TPR) repeat protein|uniref:tetratricopeptide repeat protein n=1 Tax=Hydrogenophaga sp. YM1 TaxID=2806262 RepID=UPI00195E5F42|nr:tetratricopeptide repeat protein [Hydrogenophaga sp. YM1]QRR35956.1 tetratricopeptide repeat protein [Hydrogenophaga sp. YM1]